MILGIDKLTLDEKALLCEMIDRTKKDSSITVDIEYIGIYKSSFIQTCVTEQEPNLTDEGKSLLQSILSKIQGQ